MPFSHRSLRGLLPLRIKTRAQKPLLHIVCVWTTKKKFHSHFVVIRASPHIFSRVLPRLKPKQKMSSSGNNGEGVARLALLMLVAVGIVVDGSVVLAPPRAEFPSLLVPASSLR